MRSPRILLVYKQSAIDYFLAGADRASILSQSADPFYARLLDAHASHQTALVGLKAMLGKHGYEYDEIERGTPFDERAYDLVIAAGGDGTFLDTAHRLANVPILGINTCPHLSVGNYCATTVPHSAVAVAAFFAGTLDMRSLKRIKLTMDGVGLSTSALNEVLFCHRSPAGMIDFWFAANSHTQRVKSSGIWIATPSGTTGAYRSAGGLATPAGASLYYLIREPYACDLDYRTGALLNNEELEIRSNSFEGAIFIDGGRREIAVPLGGTLRISSGAPPLRVCWLN